jgi:hypothetical protein
MISLNARDVSRRRVGFACANQESTSATLCQLPVRNNAAFEVHPADQPNSLRPQARSGQPARGSTLVRSKSMVDSSPTFSTASCNLDTSRGTTRSNRSNDIKPSNFRRLLQRRLRLTKQKKTRSRYFHTRPVHPHCRPSKASADELRFQRQSEAPGLLYARRNGEPAKTQFCDRCRCVKPLRR